jgi:hypothetical protein
LSVDAKHTRFNYYGSRPLRLASVL